jgi:hypothetical protein
VGSVASISRTVEKHVRSILTKLDLSEPATTIAGSSR